MLATAQIAERRRIVVRRMQALIVNGRLKASHELRISEGDLRRYKPLPGTSIMNNE